MNYKDLERLASMQTIDLVSHRMSFLCSECISIVKGAGDEEGLEERSSSLINELASLAMYGYLLAEHVSNNGGALLEHIINEKVHECSLASKPKWPSIDGKEASRNEVVFGKSDDVPWKLLSYNPEESPYTLECMNANNGTVKQLKPEWLYRLLEADKAGGEEANENKTSSEN